MAPARHCRLGKAERPRIERGSWRYPDASPNQLYVRELQVSHLLDSRCSVRWVESDTLLRTEDELLAETDAIAWILPARIKDHERDSGGQRSRSQPGLRSDDDPVETNSAGDVTGASTSPRSRATAILMTDVWSRADSTPIYWSCHSVLSLDRV